jgi:hypothetical protein
VRVTKNPTLAVAICLAMTCALRAIDSTWNYAVEINAAVQASPAQITLGWKQDTSGTPISYAVYRKAPTGTIWSSPLATLPGSSTSFTDANVVAGTVYEYQIVKEASVYKGYGYIQAGINVPLVDRRGTVILLVDDTFATSLATELQRLKQDLVGDGWVVIRHDVGRNDSVVNIKNLIRADYSADPANVNTVFLFGHVPVPYSGLLNPDGHPEHLGAWPADVYYGELDGAWTDSSVNFVQPGNGDPADGVRLTNVPGDGKFDQSTIPGVVKLNVGRVDLSNMPGYLQYQSQPSFPNEKELLRQYLNKDHNFRNGSMNVQRRAIMGDYSGDKDGIAPAASGFRSFAPIVGNGPASLTNLNILYNDAPGQWLPTLKSNDYLFALGVGAGSYTTVSGIGLRPPYGEATTADLVSNDVRAVFVMLFGSWCGDWDSQDNIVRGVLATPTYGLAAVYTGVPHWYLHPMGLGETIGYCTRLTQNNTNPGLYQHQVILSANMVHIALMGDPTLRLYSVAPASGLSATAANGQVNLSWVASPDATVAGYHVYRASSANGPFARLTSSLSAATSFTDSNAPASASYMVRAVKLETTPSGSYFNGSEGIFAASSGGSVTPPPAAAGSRLVNLSVRAHAGTGGQTLTVGFFIGGAGTVGTMPVLIRATGPALQVFGVDGVLPDPILTVYQGGTIIGLDDNWGVNAAQVSSTGAAVGAFRLPDSTSTDAALTATYPSGAYSAQVSGKGGSSGIALAEVYDATSSGGDATTMPRLINVSARTQVSTGSDVLIVGFVVSGTTVEKVLIRGIGPGLEKFGVTGVLANPQLTLFASNGSVVATNAAWRGDSNLAAVFTQVGAFALDATSADSALVANLQPGAYTAQVSGQEGSTGVALAEVYEVK